MSKILSVLSCCLIFNSVNGFITPRILQAGAAVRPSSILSAEKSNVGEDDFISDFCIGTNTFWKGLVMKPVRDLVDVRPATITPDSPIIDKLTSPPEIPGISRPVWLSVLGSVQRAWFGMVITNSVSKKSSFNMSCKLQQTGKVSGCGGYGTLLRLTWPRPSTLPLPLLPIVVVEFATVDMSSTLSLRHARSSVFDGGVNGSKSRRARRKMKDGNRRVSKSKFLLKWFW